jgi:hypothetical protein
MAYKDTEIIALKPLNFEPRTLNLKPISLGIRNRYLFLRRKIDFAFVKGRRRSISFIIFIT